MITKRGLILRGSCSCEKFCDFTILLGLPQKLIKLSFNFVETSEGYHLIQVSLNISAKRSKANQIL